MTIIYCDDFTWCTFNKDGVCQRTEMHMVDDGEYSNPSPKVDELLCVRGVRPKERYGWYGESDKVLVVKRRAVPVQRADEPRK